MKGKISPEARKILKEGGYGIYDRLRNSSKRKMTDEDIEVGKWLSAALDDPSVCTEMKQDINNWFNTFS